MITDLCREESVELWFEVVDDALYTALKRDSSYEQHRQNEVREQWRHIRRLKLTLLFKIRGMPGKRHAKRMLVPPPLQLF